jgi:glycosyltransferase involved in cell wall biosynthesis
MKIFISAYACSPFKGSEAGVGWGFVCELAKFHDLWVIVEEEKFRSDIEKYLDDNPDFPSTVHFYYLRKKRNRLLRRIWPPSYYFYYRHWHKQAFLIARKLNTEVGFDLVHQLTMVGFREPGYLWQLGIPFVWGPVGGMGLFPWRYFPTVGAYGSLFYLGYNLINVLHMRFLRRPRLAARVAGLGLIAATPENQTGAAHYWGCHSTLLSEVGMLTTYKKFEPLQRSDGEPLRIVWTGLHIPRKALNLGLAALGALSDQPWELHILGEGDLTSNWKAQADVLGISNRCQFHGWVAREIAVNIMANAHVMLITSLRDLTSTVTIEALSMGLPVVCLDHCGFAWVVDESCGIKVPVTNPAATIFGLTNALRDLALDDKLRLRLAHGAVRRSQDFAWDKKVEVVNRIYRQVLVQASKL